MSKPLSTVKARLYGEVHAMHLPWPHMWVDVQEQLSEHNRIERKIVEALTRCDDTGHLDVLARLVFEGRGRGPRPDEPHPYLPHTGRFGVLARRLWTVADRFRDSAQGRVHGAD